MSGERLDELIGRHLDDALADGEAAELNALLREDPAARRRFWVLARQRQLLADVLAAPSPAAARAAPRRARPLAMPRLVLAAAAVVLALGAVGMLLVQRGHPAAAPWLSDGDDAPLVERDGARLPRGERRLRPGDAIRSEVRGIELAYDGEATRLSLAPGTVLRLVADPSSKRLALERGALRASVAKQPPGAPLIVDAPHARATVVGTVFSLEADGDGSRLAVAEGLVRLAPDGDPTAGVEVAAGMSALADAAGVTPPVAAAAPGAWIDQTWDPGLPDGIPRYPVAIDVRQAPYSAAGDGVADDGDAIQRAIDACPEGNAVRLPEGRYRITRDLVLRSRIAVRGDGPGRTLVLGDGGGFAITIWNQPDSPRRIVGDAARGATEVAVDDASGIAPGALLLIDSLAAGEVSNVGYDGPSASCSRDGGRRPLGQMVQAIAVDGSRVRFAPALYDDHPGSASPELVATAAPGPDRIDHAGVEDLAYRGRRGARHSHFRFDRSAYCWLRGVVSDDCDYAHVVLSFCYRCEIRESVFRGFRGASIGAGFGVMVRQQSSAVLVEDNVVLGCTSGCVLAAGASGNVIGYNAIEGWLGPDRGLPADLLVIEAHPSRNLFEGNVVDQFAATRSGGTSGRNTLFRNALRGVHDGVGGSEHAVTLAAGALGYRAVGNVLGVPGRAVLEEQTGARAPWDQPALWHLGYAAEGDADLAGDDVRVAATLLRFGNVDAGRGAVRWTAERERTLPPSLYRRTRPGFLATAPWPVIGPDVPGQVGALPAAGRLGQVRR